MEAPQRNILRVGLIGAGEVAQTIHLPVLSLLSNLFQVTAICDVSLKTVSYVAAKFKIPILTTDPHELLALPNIDVVFILTSDQYHAIYATLALTAGKHVFVEKPLTLSLPAAQAIVDAETEANGPRVFVGYMRRYAPSFTEAFKREVATIPKILYARVRDILGPNSYFVNQSGTEPVKFDDYPAGDVADAKVLLNTLLQEALGSDGEEVTKEKVQYWRFLGSLGSHDLSLMREALGFPTSVAGVSVKHPFYSAIFNYHDPAGGREPFSVTYESGVDTVPRFDAHLAIYGEAKTVSIQYDTPYVKGLPIRVRVDEKIDGEVVTREIVSSYEDAYTVELKEMHECFTLGKPIKTSAADAMNDLRLFTLMMKRYEEARAMQAFTRI